MVMRGLWRNFKYLLVKIKRPVAAPIPCQSNDSFILHGRYVNCSFNWLKELSPMTTCYIEEENRFANSYFAKEKKLLDKAKHFFSPLHEHVASDLKSLYEEHGNFQYYFEYDTTGLPNVYRRKSIALDGTKQLVIKPSAFNAKYVSIGSLKISPPEQHVAVLLDKGIDGCHDCCVVKITETGPVTEAIIENVSSVEWQNDNVLLATKKCANDLWVNELVYIKFQDDLLEELVYQEKDKSFSLHLSKSTSGEYIFLNVSSKLSTEVWSIPTDNIDTELKLLWPRSEQREAYIDHYADTFFSLTTSEDDGEYCVKRRSVESEDWNNFIDRDDPSVFISDVAVHGTDLVLSEQRELIPHIRVVSLHGDDPINHYIKNLHTPGVMEINTHQQVKDDIQFSFTSPIQPLTVYSCNYKTNNVRQISCALPTWETNSFEYKRLDSPSNDGTMVPISIFHHKNVEISKAPMMCYFYGAYGVPVNLRFNQLDAYLLNEGWIIAYPHIRGGQELGKHWHYSAILNKKEKTFEDADSSLEFLHHQGYSTSKRTALSGTSAGGLPVAVLLNRRPDLFAAAVMQVPFLCVLDAILDDDNSLTTQEFAEWGNPRKIEDDFRRISNYCPYVNMDVSKGSPSVYVTSAVTDEHVPYWIPLQWVAKRRTMKPDSSLVCRIRTVGGHYGYDFTETQQQDAEIVTFLYKSLQL